MTVVRSSMVVTLVVAATGVALVATPSVLDIPTRFIWNASASAPIGLYSVQRADTINVNDLVVVPPSEHLRSWLDERGYLAADVPLIKRIAALPGQTVCRNDQLITIDGVAIAPARDNDRRGRPLPVWSGCQTLDPESVFLLNWDVPDSLDGRYFGLTDRAAITGRLTPLWTFSQP